MNSAHMPAPVPLPPSPDPAAAGWEARLRERGYRSTRARRLVLAALDRLGHATVEELLAAVAVDDLDVNQSTIYRTLEVLGEVGLVTHVHLAQGSPTYHSALAPTHIHLVCRGCGTVTEAPATVTTDLVNALATDYEFTADVAHIAVHGWCAQCAGQPTGDGTRGRALSGSSPAIRSVV